MQIEQEAKCTLGIPFLGSREKEAIMKEKYLTTIKPVKSCVYSVHMHIIIYSVYLHVYMHVCVSLCQKKLSHSPSSSLSLFLSLSLSVSLSLTPFPISLTLPSRPLYLHSCYGFWSTWLPSPLSWLRNQTRGTSSRSTGTPSTVHSRK